MTAAGLDALSDGRCVLGLGASGPQVIEGFHGVVYDRPLGPHPRDHRHLPAGVAPREGRAPGHRAIRSRCPPGQGTGLGKPLKLINHPVRDAIPIFVASLGPRNVEMTAELADGWLPLFYLPEKAKQVWGDDLAAGAAKRSPDLGPLDVVPAGCCRSARAPSPSASSPGRWSRCTPAAWGPRAATSTTTSSAATATRPRPSRSRTCTSTAARTRPPPWCPTTCSSRCRCAAPRATCGSGRRRSRRAASPPST